MYFKQLEMTGFKSFADRTLLRLDPGITAVVGPNGCGKSNILDALRWVLGEQRSKELRGSHMQDVIFNGSENRHPLGMSEVSITFDNSDSRLPVDFAEVEVTRRLYRSGESEYLINKAQCRLRDINELFMDTGIGTQAYSMIGQGKMDLILSQKPEDRRFLFEEAAGIIKYKNRKRLAVRRLESAEQNLLRLSDIIAEIERQMRSLKRQVNAAIRYREISEELRSVEIRAAWLKYVRFTEAIQGLRDRLAAAQDQYAKSSAETATLEARHEELDLQKLEADRELVTRREAVHAIDTEMERLEREIALARQRIDFARAQQTTARTEAETFRSRMEEIERRLQETAVEREKTQGELAESLAAIEARSRTQAEAAQRVSEAEARLEQARAAAVERMNERARNQTELETLDVRIGNIEQQLQALDTRQGAEDGRRVEVQAALDAARAEEARRNALAAELEQQHAAAVKQGADAAAELRALNEKWQGLRETKSSVDARLNSLRELRDNYEGFAVGVRAVMRAKSEGRPRMDGLIGPAGDLLSTEKRYERAIEAALGGNINNVVCEDADAAKHAIDFLKRHNAGRVTFLPLDIIRAGEGDRGDGLIGRPGVIGPAIDYVEFDARVRPAAEYLLHSTVIVETLDHAIQLARSNRRIPRLVTLEGDVVTSSGAVTGGRNKHESRGLLGRSAEIAELEAKLESLEGEIRAIAERGQALTQTMQDSERQARELDGQRAEQARELGRLGVTIARQTTELDNLGASLEQLAAQRQELARGRDEFAARRREAAERAQTLDSGDEALQRAIAEAQEATVAAREELSARASEVGELRLRHAGLNQRLAELDRDRERMAREREEALSEGDRRKALDERLARDQQAFEQAVRAHVDNSGALSQRKDAAQAEVTTAENRRKELLDETERIDAELKTLRDRARAAQAEMHSSELELRLHEDKVAFFQERILSEYNIALASLTAEEVGEDDYDEDARDALVADLRGRLQRMGDVNLMAIEEYQALEERHAFLSSQCEDLRKAREALLGVIARSDKKIREMFMETFEQVAATFREYFRRLFNGGQARVYLMNDEDPLECGIEIEARPPGKKPQTISLLSGGESAMTAIALLFSILKAKPTPFCVLDEVDAPLDDANIGRFLNMLDDFSQETQFVVITHNKQTMARANAMYGVTMQERGVSQLISARMTEDAESDSAA